MEAQLRGTCGRVDREMATRACQMRMASQRPGQEEGKALFTAMEKELQQLHFDLLLAQGAANGQDFTSVFTRLLLTLLHTGTMRPMWRSA